MTFANRTALVTGAGRGVGRQIARLLAGDGATVALLARSRDQLEETERLVKEAGGSALVVPVDLADPVRRAEAVLAVLAEYGGVDILVNNAGGTAPIGPTATVDPAAWAANVQLTLIAPAALTAAVLPGMLERRWGRVVNVSSAAVAMPGLLIGSNAYVAGKAGLEAHTLNLAAELADTGVQVNVYRPGAVATGLLRASREATLLAYPGMAAVLERGLADVITPEASATALVAHLREGVTGQIWHVDRTV